MMLLTNNDHFVTKAGRKGKRLVLRLEVHGILKKSKCLFVKIMMQCNAKSLLAKTNYWK